MDPEDDNASDDDEKEDTGDEYEDEAEDSDDEPGIADEPFRDPNWDDPETMSESLIRRRPTKRWC